MEDLEAKISDSKPHDSSPLKLYFLPFLAPGHMIPQINLAQVFAFRDHNVTILTTPSNAKLIPKHLNVHILNFPSDEVGLPSGVENLSLAKDNHTAYKIWKAAKLLKPEIESLLHHNPPHALIIDIMYTWRSTLNNSIPTFVYSPMPVFALCVVEAINRHPQTLASDSSLPYVVPGGLPHNVTLNFNPSSTSFDNMARTLLHAKENNKHGVIVNTFPELEDGYTQYYEKLTGVKVWHLGMLSLMVNYFDKRGKPQENQVDDECLKWLNTKEPNSVVYICFGSLARLNKEQNFEIARGIEASGHKFLWVLPKDTDDDVKEEELLLPHGFEERMREKKRGMLVRGWVPQGLILKHDAIGGFLTHCGANSVVEAICEGVPMITMPRFGDHFLCEKQATEVLGFGMEVGVSEWSMSPYDARKEVVVWERIENAVRKVMKDEGGSLNKRVKEMKEKAHEAVQEGGNSYNNVTTLVQSLKRMMSVHGGC